MSGLGYLFPAIRLAHILQKRGQQVLFVSTVEHAITLDSCGIAHVAVRNDGAPFLNTAGWYNPGNSVNEVKVFDNVIQQYKPDVIVANPLTLGAFVMAEKYGIPLINIGFTEYLYPSLNGADPDKEWRIKSITDFYNAYRAPLGLAPIACSAEYSPLIGDKYLLRSVPGLNKGAKLPAKVACVGGLYWEPAYTNIPLENFIAETIKSKRPLVYMQIGRLFEAADNWETLTGILARLPMNFVADIGRSDYIRSGTNVPNNFFADPFIPIGKIAGDIDFVICSGQSTSVISAIVHGKQILSIPHSADSTELTHKLETNGLAIGVHGRKNITFEVICGAINRLQHHQLQDKALEYSRLFDGYTDDHIFDVIDSV